MATKTKKLTRRAKPILSTGAGGRMTTDQKTLLRQLAFDGYEPEAFYRTIVREPVVEAAPPTVEYRVGMRVPPSARLYAVPQSVVTEVPTMRTYKYMVVNHHIVLVDPATSEVVAELAD